MWHCYYQSVCVASLISSTLFVYHDCLCSISNLVIVFVGHLYFHHHHPFSCCSSRVMQCDAVCCSVLQCVAVCCSVLHHLQHRPLNRCSSRVLQCVAVRCSALQCVAACCRVLHLLQHRHVGCYSSRVLQCAVVRCSALQCVARAAPPATSPFKLLLKPPLLYTLSVATFPFLTPFLMGDLPL